MQDGEWSSEDVVQSRKMSITMVLGTDMKKHFDIVSRFQVSLLLLHVTVALGMCMLHILTSCWLWCCNVQLSRSQNIVLYELEITVRS